MLSLIPNEKLSYYFTKLGYPKFKEWYKSLAIFTPIYSELEILTTIIDKSTWLEDELRYDAFKNIKNIINKCIEINLGKHSEIIYKEWIDSIQHYCFQGGIGYKIQYTDDNIPHHWCVRPEYYKYILNIPNNVILSGIVCDKYCNISEILEEQKWNN